MGVIEAVLEQLSARVILSFLLFAIVLHRGIQRFDEHRRIKRLGNYGKNMGSWVPLGSLICLSVSSNLLV